VPAVESGGVLPFRATGFFFEICSPTLVEVSDFSRFGADFPPK